MKTKRRVEGQATSGKLAHSDKNQLAGAIRSAIGAGPKEDVIFRTPQFERPPRWPKPGSAPKLRSEWDALREMTSGELKDMGCGNWDGRLMLFPGEWYRFIPDGLPIEDISGNLESFASGATDDDIRFGCLAFGVPAVDGIVKPDQDPS